MDHVRESAGVDMTNDRPRLIEVSFPLKQASLDLPKGCASEAGNPRI